MSGNKSGKVIGIDEVGTGAFAGPAYVCAVAVDSSWLVTGLKDSKELTKPKISEMYHQLVNEHRVEFVLEVVTVEAIDRDGLGVALADAWLHAGRQMQERYEDARVFLDGSRKPEGADDHWFAIPNADAHIPCVMAAAIIAKYLRDQYMIEQAKLYPHYGWETNVGYGAPAHIEGLNAHGVTPLHRTSFKPVQKYMVGARRRFGAQQVDENIYERWVKDAAKSP